MNIDFTTRVTSITQPTLQQLIDQCFGGFKGAVVRHVTMQFQCQGRLLEEAKRDLAETRRDLEACKRELSNTKRDRHDLEQEQQALKDEIRQLKGRGMHGYEEMFEWERRALNDWILRLEAIVTRERRAVYQQNSPPVSAGTRQHAMVLEGSKAA